MRIYTKCKTEKDNSEFSGKIHWCRLCVSLYDKARYQTPTRKTQAKELNIAARIRNRELIYNYYATHPCIVCGESDPIVLEFDHKAEFEKIGNISDMVGQASSISAIQKEIDKCDVLCANCHRRQTAKQFNWYADLIGES